MKTFGLSCYEGNYALHVPAWTRDRKIYSINKKQAIHLFKRYNCEAVVSVDKKDFES